ncbi:hypothetical protein CHUAL_003304 [Chamberlinius hualienensis]
MLRRKKSDKLTKSSPRSSSKMDSKEEDEDRWVFDSLVGFLTGPIWNMPLLDFIESKCCEFETTGEKDEYLAVIHNEYKQLVDVMLNSFMQDMGISAEQFEKACINARSENHEGLAHIRQTLLQQICAAEDYAVFVHMMEQKNNELQLQTLQYLQHVEQKTNSEPRASDENDRELQYVLLQSLQEHEELMSQLGKEKEEIDKVLATTLEEEKFRLENENRIEMEMLKKAMQLSLDESENGNTSFEENAEAYRGASPSPSVTTCSSPLTPETQANNGKDLQLYATTYNTDLQSPKSEHPTIDSKNDSDIQRSEGISEMEVANRRDYLRRQRDKIVAMKRNVRKMQMQKLDDNPAVLQRPKSAKTAKNALENTSNAVQLDPEILAARQALARRLKTEVVSQNPTLT